MDPSRELLGVAVTPTDAPRGNPRTIDAHHNSCKCHLYESGCPIRITGPDAEKEQVMLKEVTCPPCGEVIRAESDEELIAAVQRHAREDHQAELTPEHILSHATSVAG